MFVLPNNSGHGAAGCSNQDMKLVTGIIHHARGSFHAAWEIFAEHSAGEVLHKEENAHKVLESLWFAWALIRFLPPAECAKLLWTGYWNNGQRANDGWLLAQRPLVRLTFLGKWAIDHVSSCATCSQCFAVGLDGKRGTKRFICACLEGPIREVPEVEARIQLGCPNQTAHGSLYCHSHDHFMQTTEAVDSEEVPKITKHRSTAKGELQLCVEEPCMDTGRVKHSWVDAGDVAASARRAYELDRLRETGPRS